jgi:hypothetical protein
LWSHDCPTIHCDQTSRHQIHAHLAEYDSFSQM